MKPTLILQTVCFDDSDHEAASQLGASLYNLLTRPIRRQLAYGPGIPVYRAVRPDCVDLNAADRLIILPVLGNETFSRRRNDVVQTLKDWHRQLGGGHVIPIPMVENWRKEERDLLGKNLLTQLYGKEDRQQRTLDEIVIAALRLFETSQTRSLLFISHAKADLQSTKNAAETIRNYVVTDSTARAFFDANDLAAGESLGSQIGRALENGVFVALRTDSYSSREWCLKELLQAKKNRLPTLTVDMLQDGEALSSPYAGNGPTVVWNGDPQPVVSRALVECLRAAYFRAEKDRIVTITGLPNDTVDLCRPPELLDLIQGPIQREHARVVIHPDPELPVAHRELLAIANPRLKLVTPTTVYRRIAESTSAVTNPFDGKQIAFSISDSPDVNGPCGFAKEHIDDVAIYLARCLISAGAHLAYGGDFRQGGYTEAFSDLISAYRQTAGNSNDILHNYLAAIIPLSDAPDDLPIEAHHLDYSPLADEALLPSPKSPEFQDIPKALYFSDMRRVMEKHMLARIILGGASQPGIEETGQKGYGGLYPGVVEEAWRTLEADHPLYVIGGFGGAAGIVGILLDGGETPKELCDATWLEYLSYRTRVEKLTGSRYLDELKLPASMEALARSIQSLGAPHLASDESSLRWNGLTLEENRELWRSRDPARIVSLVFEGLRKYWQCRIEGKLEVELVEGSVTLAQNLNVVAIGVFDGMPLGGAGAALDRLISGRASLAHAGKQTLVSLESGEVAADYLYLSSLGQLGDIDDLAVRVRDAAASTAECVLRHGFSRLGVVSFGGGMSGDLEEITASMIAGLEPLSGQATVAWFENDPGRFTVIQRILGQDVRVNLTTRRQLEATATVSTPVEQVEQMILSVTLANDMLSTTVMPPSGTAVARTTRAPFTRKDMISFSRGVGGRNTPPATDLENRGHQLSKLLFGDDADDLITRCREAKVMLIHDVPSSQLPFEILRAGTDADAILPAVGGGINRRLAVSGVTTHQLFAKPPHIGKLKVMVVINPLGDLEGAEEEGQAVIKALSEVGNVETIDLIGKKATKAAFLEMLVTADVLHYCGHAFFDGPGAEESGLSLYGDPLFFTDLIGFPSSVRVVFANACEAGRVRNLTNSSNEAASFAEYFLRTGVEAYLGTYWKVADAAAASFSSRVYASLGRGETLDQAVLEGRNHLHRECNSPEWANYVLYGEGRFQLVKK